MTTLWQGTRKDQKEILETLTGKTYFSDAFVNELPLMGSPSAILCIFAAYMFFVKFAGPKFMESRKPYNLNTFTRIYNIFQVFTCIWLVSQVPDILGSFNPYKCYNGPSAIISNQAHLSISWYVLILRMSEFLETVVFVLRKKQNQVSWLHVYHHIAVVSLLWMFFKFSATRNEIIIIAINTAVHIVMYFYYFLSSFSKLKSITVKSKPFITAMQITQLVIIMTHIIHALACCEVTKLYWLQLGNIVILIAMFLQFYFKSYRSEKVKSK